MVTVSDAITKVQYKDTPLVATRNIRVLMIITGLATGGATNVALDLSSYFKNRSGFDVQLLTGPVPPGRNDATHLANERGIPTRFIPSLINQINPIANLKAVADIRRIMLQGEYDIVHTHSSVAGVVGRLAAISAGIPVIIHHVHGWGLHDGMPAWTRWLYLALERFCARFTDRIITVSGPDIKKGQSQIIGDTEKFSLIYNGIDLEKFRQVVDAQQLRAELGLAQDTKLVGMIGRLDEQKNPIDFIKAAAIASRSYQKVQFLIIGDGSLRPECERLIADLNLEDKVFLLGYSDDVARILPILSLTAMSSLWEGLPLAFLEAMSAGKPIVANDIDGASDVVVNGETGFLVTPHKPEEMADRMLTLLTNETLSNRMAKVAQQRSSEYSLEKMVGKVEVLYKELHSTAQPNPAPLRRLLQWIAGRRIGMAAAGFDTPKLGLLGRLTESYSRFQAPISERRLLLTLGDAFSVLMAQFLTILLWNGSTQLGTSAIFVQHASVWYLFPSELAIWFSLAWLNDLYHIPSSYNKALSLQRILKTTILALLINVGVFFFFPDVMPRDDYFMLAALPVPLVASWRWFYAVVFKRNAFRQRILLVGNKTRSQATMQEIQKCDWVNYDVIGYVHDREPKITSDKLQYLGQSAQLMSVIDRHKVHSIVVAINGKLRNKLFNNLVECQAMGVRVDWLPEFYERMYQRVPMEQIDPSWALYMIQNRPAFNRLELTLKRLLDLVLVLFALPILLFIFVPIAIAIKLESPGSVFYRQVRCGRAGKPFTIYKFRTMVNGAEHDGVARWAFDGDPRITRVGHFLRKSRLDEVPQLLNVLFGDMSMVGPRPERPEFVEELETEVRYYRMRLLVKPGITGWAQVNYDYGNTVDHARMKLQYDLYYVRYWSIWQDVYILFRTIGVMLQLKGT
ncbi:MAG TPA: exopolysaccharide biosynthesis polyprenyl glycosylphosphotransferase [Anaerolineales bacterium]|nr:exopolysaccharide biosynthesis polyprenyl glycosylphosphotransferase [Anaerolineales bacterium]